MNLFWLAVVREKINKGLETRINLFVIAATTANK
jgi:hypothetical protein